MAGIATKGSKIVVAVNESEESLHSLSWCLQNFIPCRKARNSDITLVLLYVKPAPPPPDHTGLFWSKIGVMLEEYGKETALTVMEKAKEMCKSRGDLENVKMESIVESGDARDVICETVDKIGADILIMGGHPLTASNRARLMGGRAPETEFAGPPPNTHEPQQFGERKRALCAEGEMPGFHREATGPGAE